MATQLFEVTTTRTQVFEEGWGVAVTPIWQDDDMPGENISDIDVEVVRIEESAVRIIGDVPCVPIPGWGSLFVPVENFTHEDDLTQDDTHDLRTRWFATEQEARDHARYTAARWVNPQPWCSFVQLDSIGRGTR